MTYCLGMLLDRGIAMMSDTRTNAGVDNISTFRKMNIWEVPGERSITLMSAGNLATTQAVVSLLDERTKAPNDRDPTLLAMPSMFQAARLIADTLRDVISEHEQSGQSAASGFGATLLIAGQIRGGPPRLFLIYPEGNFIEAGTDTPFFQIGETKYGRPILVRAYDPTFDFADAMRLLLVSFDSTVKANLSVGAPFDYHFYEADSLRTGLTGRIEAEDPRFLSISQGWGEALKTALESLPSFEFQQDPSRT